MTEWFLIVMASLGLSVSYILLADSAKKEREARTLCASARAIEDAVRYSRAPVERMMKAGASSPAVSPADLLGHPDAEIARLAYLICSSDYEAALSYAEQLEKYTEKEMNRVTEAGMRTRRAKAVLPPCAAILAALMLI